MNSIELQPSMVETLNPRSKQSGLVRVRSGKAKGIKSELLTDKKPKGSNKKQEVSKTTTRLVSECIDAILEIYKIYGFEANKVDKVRESTIIHWLKLVELCDGKWKDVAKYKLAAFMSYHTHDTLPATPWSVVVDDHPGAVLSGAGYRYVNNLKHSLTQGRFLGFLTSILQSKKGMPRLGKEALKKAEIDMVTALTEHEKEMPEAHWNSDFRSATPIVKGKIHKEGQRFQIKQESWADIQEQTFHIKNNEELVPDIISKKQIKLQLRRTVKELFKDQKFTDEDRHKMYFPSTSANYINNRAGAGAVGTILDHPELLEGLREPTLPGPTIFKKNSIVEIKEKEKIVTNDDYIENEDIDELVFEFDDKALKEKYNVLYNRIVTAAMTESPDVVPVALAEPLKIRTISKGPPLLYTALKPLQKFMHRTLRFHPTFELIGKPVNKFYMQKILGKDLKEDEKFLSGDYAAATDRLKPWVSEEIAHAISDEIGLSQDERTLFIRSLTGHNFVIDGVSKKQNWGQLMGSITSFPVLCIANAAVCRMAIEFGIRKTCSLRQCKLMINGDDVGAIMNMASHEFWEAVSKFAGLELSIGKCYFNKDFININSTNYEFTTEYTETNPENQRLTKLNFRQVGYINLGLLFLMKKSSLGNDKHKEKSTIGACYREMLRLADQEDHKILHQRFITINNKELVKYKVPWYVPEWLGGYGLNGVILPSEWDLKIIAKIKQDHMLDKIARIADAACWSLHKYVLNRLPQKPYSHETEEGKSNYDKLYASLTMEALFRCNLNELFDENPRETIKQSYKKNEKLWQSLARPEMYKHLPHASSYYPQVPTFEELELDQINILQGKKPNYYDPGILKILSYNYINVSEAEIVQTLL